MIRQVVKNRCVGILSDLWNLWSRKKLLLKLGLQLPMVFLPGFEQAETVQNGTSIHQFINSSIHQFIMTALVLLGGDFPQPPIQGEKNKFSLPFISLTGQIPSFVLALKIVESLLVNS